MQFAAKKVFVGRQHEEVDEEELRGVRAQLETASRSARAPVRSKRVEYNATNVLALDLPSLVSTAVISTGEMLRCTCGAVFSSVSKVEGKSWQCEFCRAVNDFSLEEEERPKTETVDYLLSGPKFEHASEDEFTVMFVVDTSGSMCVTQSVEAGKIKLKGGAVQDAEVLAFREHGAAQILPNEQQNVQYVSRLQCVQAAVEAQILALKKSHPRCKVGVVSFSSDVIMVGDGTSAPVTIAGDRLNNLDGLISSGGQVSKLQTVSESAERLISSVYSLTEKGTTALGPGLCVALGMMRNASPGSKIIICTDGMANMGVGNIEDALELDGVWSFYRDVAGRAKVQGIPISIISIAGSQCKMEVLGSLAEISGGDVDILKPEEILTKFANLAEEKVIATNVHLTLLLDHRMTVVDPLKPDHIASIAHKEVGTVTQSSSFSFEFKVRNEALAQGIKEGALPFQVQIRYTRLDGSELVRVQTLEQKVTQNQQEAEAEVNLNVVAQNAVQSAAEYASSGNYGKARERMVMQQRLMQRTSPSPAYAPQSPMYAAAAPAPGMPQQQQQQQQQTYNAYVQQAVELDDLLQAQERAEAPNLDEEALNRSRVSSRSDTLSKAIYKAKSNRK